MRCTAACTIFIAFLHLASQTRVGYSLQRAHWTVHLWRRCQKKNSKRNENLSNKYILSPVLEYRTHNVHCTGTPCIVQCTHEGEDKIKFPFHFILPPCLRLDNEHHPHHKLYSGASHRDDVSVGYAIYEHCVLVILPSLYKTYGENKMKFPSHSSQDLKELKLAKVKRHIMSMYDCVRICMCNWQCTAQRKSGACEFHVSNVVLAVIRVIWIEVSHLYVCRTHLNQ